MGVVACGFGGGDAQYVGPLLQCFLVYGSISNLFSIIQCDEEGHTVRVRQSGISSSVEAIAQPLADSNPESPITTPKGKKSKLIHLHPRPRSRIRRKITPNHVPPSLRRLTRLPTRTLIIPSGGILRSRRASNSEATIGHAGVDGPGFEDVRVGASEHVGHHGAAGGAGHVGAVGVAAVGGNGVFYHVGDGLGVAAAVVG